MKKVEGGQEEIRSDGASESLEILLRKRLEESLPTLQREAVQETASGILGHVQTALERAVGNPKTRDLSAALGEAQEYIKENVPREIGQAESRLREKLVAEVRNAVIDIHRERIAALTQSLDQARGNILATYRAAEENITLQAREGVVPLPVLKEQLQIQREAAVQAFDQLNILLRKGLELLQQEVSELTGAGMRIIEETVIATSARASEMVGTYIARAFSKEEKVAPEPVPAEMTSLRMEPTRAAQDINEAVRPGGQEDTMPESVPRAAAESSAPEDLKPATAEEVTPSAQETRSSASQEAQKSVATEVPAPQPESIPVPPARGDAHESGTPREEVEPKPAPTIPPLQPERPPASPEPPAERVLAGGNISIIGNQGTFVDGRRLTAREENDVGITRIQRPISPRETDAGSSDSKIGRIDVNSRGTFVDGNPVGSMDIPGVRIDQGPDGSTRIEAGEIGSINFESSS